MSDRGRAPTWDECEAAVAAALSRMRELASASVTAVPPEAHLGLVDVVRGTAGVWEAFWLHADLHTTDEVCAIVPDLRPLTDIAEGATLDQVADVADLLATRDLRIRLIVPEAAAGSTVARAVVDQLVASGIDLRLGESSRWFFLSRDRVVATPLQWDETDDVEVAVLRTRPLVAAFAELFEQRWHASSPWGGDSTSADQVLRLLARGLDDDQVAAELGISIRTVRRRVADAMHEHGASSRFELGCRWATRATMSETR